MLLINHDQCKSVSIKSYFLNRPNCLGLDVTKAEKILNMKMPSMRGCLPSIDFSIKIKLISSLE